MQCSNVGSCHVALTATRMLYTRYAVPTHDICAIYCCAFPMCDVRSCYALCAVLTRAVPRVCRRPDITGDSSR
eukprot:292675-Rhodomonas_salina.1